MGKSACWRKQVCHTCSDNSNRHGPSASLPNCDGLSKKLHVCYCNRSIVSRLPLTLGLGNLKSARGEVH